VLCGFTAYAAQEMSIDASISLTTTGAILVRQTSNATQEPRDTPAGLVDGELSPSRSPARAFPTSPLSESSQRATPPPPTSHALMKAQVFPAAEGGGSVIAVQRLRGEVMPHLQQFVKMKAQVEQAAAVSQCPAQLTKTPRPADKNAPLRPVQNTGHGVEPGDRREHARWGAARGNGEVAGQ
jgi:hypothetical protein